MTGIEARLLTLHIYCSLTNFCVFILAFIFHIVYYILLMFYIFIPKNLS